MEKNRGNMSLAHKQSKAMSVLFDAITKHDRPLVALSGGKDSLVVAHMAHKLGVRDFICETSFYFEPALSNIKNIVSNMGISPVYRSSLNVEWLKKNSKVIFASDTKIRAWGFAVRQQATVKRYAKDIGSDLQVFGRRTQENSVKSSIYQTKAGTQCHPIRDWRHEDVWQYLSENAIPKPMIYDTRFGEIEGNGPFYILNEASCGGYDKAWEIVSGIDPQYHRGMFDA